MKKTLFINNFLYYFTLLAFACMAYGFLWSRVFYSIGLLFIGLQFLAVSSTSSLNSIFTNKYFLITLSIPLCNLLRDGVNNIFLINLTIPLFVAFYLANRYKEEWLKNGILISSVVFLITATHTFFVYFSDIGTTIELYKIAQVVSVGAFNDHIRFSIALSLSIMVLFYFYRIGLLTKNEKIYVKCYIGFVVLFLHILAARTGLMLLYFMAFIWIILKVLETRNYWKLVFLFLFPVLPVISYYSFPSFYHRVGYSFYDYQYYKNMTYKEGSSDGVRYYSILSGLDIFQKKPIWGVGFEDLRPACDEWFSSKFPIMSRDVMMLPHNQFIVYAASAGIIGLSLVLLLYLYPLSIWKKISLEGRVMLLGFLFISLVDVFFDSQLKIYVFGLFIPLAIFHMPERKPYSSSE
jgi:O-antigen ligase